MAAPNDAALLTEDGDPDSEAMTSVAIFTSDDVRMIAADATIGEAAVEMTVSDLGLLVVGDRQNVEGVVSERDIVRAVAAGRDVTRTKVRDLETMSLLWCDRDASVAEVAEMMLEHYVRHILVEDSGRLVGVVSARDLLGAFVAGL
jgi:CBS domain-containing protein